MKDNLHHITQLADGRHWVGVQHAGQRQRKAFAAGELDRAIAWRDAQLAALPAPAQPPRRPTAREWRECRARGIYPVYEPRGRRYGIRLSLNVHGSRHSLYYGIVRHGSYRLAYRAALRQRERLERSGR